MLYSGPFNGRFQLTVFRGSDKLQHCLETSAVDVSSSLAAANDEVCVYYALYHTYLARVNVL
jgi:hypothetical protein